MSDLDTAKQKIIDTAMELRNSGYDGEFIGPVCVPLFTALAKYEQVLMNMKTKEEGRCRTCFGSGQVEIQSGPYSRDCKACNGTGQITTQNEFRQKLFDNMTKAMNEEPNKDDLLFIEKVKTLTNQQS